MLEFLGMLFELFGAIAIFFGIIFVIGWILILPVTLIWTYLSSIWIVSNLRKVLSPRGWGTAYFFGNKKRKIFI